MKSKLATYVGIAISLLALSVSANDRNKTTSPTTDIDSNYDNDRIADTDGRRGTYDTDDNLIGASKVEGIKFKKGQTALSSEEKSRLRGMINDTRIQDIYEVKVLVWGDREASMEKNAPESDVNLAEKRGQVIREYLNDVIRTVKKDSKLDSKDLTMVDIDVHNMSKSPSEIAQFFKSDDYELKSANKSVDKMSWKAKGGPSKSLVLIVPEKE